MSTTDQKQLKVLVAIASYGTSNDRYLKRILQEYRAMPYRVDIIVLSNLHKQLPDGVELRVGLPAKDPWSLPFAHKKIFADQLDRYDLFVYSEDDVLITERNLRAFLDACKVLPKEDVAGFLRFERGPHGEISYPEVHHRYHWQPGSVRTYGEDTFAYFTNEHSACYVLTREQLRRAIESGGFLVGPHSGKYDMLCAAATDPYTRCGLKKMICISRMDDFVVHHLPNKYVGKLGLLHEDFHSQVEALQQLAQKPSLARDLLENGHDCTNWLFAKNYYEPVREDVLSLLPQSTHSVLSIGCGWGAAEQELIRRGKSVVAFPLDPIVSACVKARGVETIECDLANVGDELKSRKFDCVLISNLLHLSRDPVGMLTAVTNALTDKGAVIAVVPNLSSAQVLWKRMLHKTGYENLGHFESSGVQLTSIRSVKRWFTSSGFSVNTTIKIAPDRALGLRKWTLGILDSVLAAELVFVAQREAAAVSPQFVKDLVRTCNG